MDRDKYLKSRIRAHLLRILCDNVYKIVEISVNSNSVEASALKCVREPMDLVIPKIASISAHWKISESVLNKTDSDLIVYTNRLVLMVDFEDSYKYLKSSPEIRSYANSILRMVNNFHQILFEVSSNNDIYSKVEYKYKHEEISPYLSIDDFVRLLKYDLTYNDSCYIIRGKYNKKNIIFDLMEPKQISVNGLLGGIVYNNSNTDYDVSKLLSMDSDNVGEIEEDIKPKDREDFDKIVHSTHMKIINLIFKEKLIKEIYLIKETRGQKYLGSNDNIYDYYEVVDISKMNKYEISFKNQISIINGDYRLYFDADKAIDLLGKDVIRVLSNILDKTLKCEI